MLFTIVVSQIAFLIVELYCVASWLMLWACLVASSMFAKFVNSTLSIAFAGVRKAGDNPCE